MPCLKNIRNLIDYIHSSLSTRILLYGFFLLIITLYVPTTAYSRLAPVDPRDGYIRKTISLDIQFAFNTSSTGGANSPDTPRQWSFSEGYRLKMSDNLVDPRFIVYDTYINYSTARSSLGPVGSSVSLGVVSTILRKFRYPITLYEHRSYNKNSVSDAFGARAYLKFRRLPTTTLTSGWNRTETPTTSTLNSRYGISMVKRIGLSYNSLSYQYAIRNDGSTNSNLAFSTRADLSRVTKTYAALSRYKFTPSDTDNSYNNGIGYTMSLTSNLSKNFSQNHNYAIYSSESNPGGSLLKTRGQNYSGSWTFLLSRNLRTGGGLSYSQNDTFSASKNSEYENLHANWSLGYTISRGLTLASNSSYGKRITNIISQTTQESSGEFFSTNIGIRYFRKIRTISFASSYSIGYTEYLSLPTLGGGQGLTQSVSISLVDALNYKKIYIKPSYKVSRTDNLMGNVWASSQAFSVVVIPRYWTQYGTMGSSYHYSKKTDWRDLGIISTNSLSLYANSKRIMKTNASLSQTFNTNKIGYLSDATEKTAVTNFSLHHNNIINKGSLNLTLSFYYRKTQKDTNVDKELVSSFTARYRKQLLRRIRWTSHFYYSRQVNKITNGYRSGMSFSNVFSYSLRRWVIGARHRFTSTSTTYSPTTYEEQLLLTLKRSFSRRF